MIRLYYLPLFLLLGGLLAPAESLAVELFGSSETESGDLKPFPKWTSVMRKHPGAVKKMEHDCDNSGCLKDKWEQLISSVQQSSNSEKIREVNSYHNKIPYVEDIVNWGKNDYWETIQEFMRRHGDCEDYAISKYYTLRRLGFEPEQMRIVILKDKNLGVMHSVLAVFDGGTALILDNQFSSVMDHGRIKHYEPVYSINEQGWWRHHL